MTRQNVNNHGAPGVCWSCAGFSLLLLLMQGISDLQKDTEMQKYQCLFKISFSQIAVLNLHLIWTISILKGSECSTDSSFAL